LAAHLAKDDEKIHTAKTTIQKVVKKAVTSYQVLEKRGLSKEQHCSHVYEMFSDGSGVSKAIAAQYLAWLLQRGATRRLAADKLRNLLPAYLVNAIEHVTFTPDAEKGA
jgi:putative ATP-dependent endonuclease of OLD family